MQHQSNIGRKWVNFELTIDNLYIVLMCELWDVNCAYLENRHDTIEPHYMLFYKARG